MAKTDTKKYTVQEKLNKMDLDVITITTPSITTNAIGELAVLPQEIANAVAVPGGSAILQTCLVYNPTANDVPLDIFISNSSQAFTGGGTDDPAVVGSTVDSANLNALASDANVATILEGVECVFNTGSGTDIGSADTINYVSSIGAPVKAAAGSTSLYLWAVSRTAVTPSAAFTIKLGFVKD
tara:strand:- start:33 stop:581 length:549 start_codon:yes stop_codon:yes gene_type:complete